MAISFKVRGLTLESISQSKPTLKADLLELDSWTFCECVLVFCSAAPCPGTPARSSFLQSRVLVWPVRESLADSLSLGDLRFRSQEAALRELIR